MILLGGATSLLVGNAFQAQMPGFAHDFGHEKQDWAYSMLLGANAGGAAIGRSVAGRHRHGCGRTRVTRAICSILWCVAIVGFAAVDGLSSSRSRCCSVAGFLNLAFSLHGANLVQLQAPAQSARALDRVCSTLSKQWPARFQRRDRRRDRTA